MIDLPRTDIDKPTDKIHDVDLLEDQGTQGTCRLPPPQLLGYLDESEDLNSVLLNLT